MPDLRDLSAVPDGHDDSASSTPGRHRVTEPSASPEPEPRLVRSEVNGRVYVVTVYDERDDGQIVPHEKYDVSEDFEQLSDDPHIPFGPALYGLAARLYDLARDETPGATRAACVDAMASNLAYTFRGQQAE